MHAVVGDRLHVRGNVVGHPDRTGEILEVRDSGGEPPYLVRFDDGHTCLMFPGPDAVVEHPQKRKTGASKTGAGKAAGASKPAPGKAAPKRKTGRAKA
jgi:Domain of unknown function (DUF1918)